MILSCAMKGSTALALRRRAGVGALLVLLVTALVIEGIPVIHAHAAPGPALYNEECPLAGLAAHTAGASLTSKISTQSPLSVSHTPELPLAPVPSCPLLSSADPRAPPAR